MAAIKQWMNGKQPVVASLALAIALSAPEVSEALVEIREKVDTNISQPPLSVWLNFYKNHRMVFDVIQDLFSSVGMQKLLAESVSGERTDLSPQQHEQVTQLYLQPATLFLFKVWGPCIVYFKTTPTQLFRQARLGKVSAFEKLLRLDNSVIFDKRLSERFHQYKGKTNKQTYQKLIFAFHSSATGRNDPKHIKSLAAAIISLMSAEMGQRLTEPQIRKLFDAIAKDRKLGLQDEDIPLAPDSFAQSIRRETKKIKKQKPYKK